MEKNNFLLVSVKSKTSQAQGQGQVYIVSKDDISSFVKKILDKDTILLIDSVETFVSEPLSIDKLKCPEEPLSIDKLIRYDNKL